MESPLKSTYRKSLEQEIARQDEVEKRREEIVKTLEESKKLAFSTDSLVKLRALQIRCDKLSNPRPSHYIYDKEKAKRIREEKKEHASKNRKGKNDELMV